MTGDCFEKVYKDFLNEPDEILNELLEYILVFARTKPD